MTSRERLPAALLIMVLIFGAWSAYKPHDIGTWLAESAPVLIALPLLIATRKKFPLTPILYIFIAIHSCILMMGGHYTYALTPLGDWMRDLMHATRNPYDRVGHFAQGFVPALIIRELLIRTSPLRWGKWMAAIIFFCCMGISACYELIEWAAAEIAGEGAAAFLGTQGDVWDTQKDMMMAGIGAIACMILLHRLHDRQLTKLGLF